MDESVSHRVARGSAYLLARQAITAGTSLVGGVALARYLLPEDFGGYALLAFLLTFSRFIIDAGLAASLVRQVTEPSKAEFDSVYTVQLTTAACLVAVLVVLSGFLSRTYGTPPGLREAICLAAFALPTAPMAAVCFAQLERALDFRSVGLLSAVQPVTFNIVAVTLAAAGLGVVGIGIAFAASNILPALLAARRVGRLPKVTRRPRAVGSRLAFGVPFIATGVISAAKDAVNPLFLGAVVGIAAAGYINWAQQLAVVGTYFLLALSRLFFPLFARFRSDQARLRRLVQRATFWSQVLVAPVAVFTFVNASAITIAIYGQQWLPAVNVLRLLTGANVLSPIGAVLIALLNALGRPLVPLAYACVYFVGTWSVIPLLTDRLGFEAYGWANLIVTIAGLPLIVQNRAYFQGHWISLWFPWGAALVVVGGLSLVGSEVFDLSRPAELGLVGVVGMAVYFGLMSIAEPSRFRELWRLMVHAAP